MFLVGWKHTVVVAPKSGELSENFPPGTFRPSAMPSSLWLIPYPWDCSFFCISLLSILRRRRRSSTDGVSSVRKDWVRESVGSRWESKGDFDSRRGCHPTFLPLVILLPLRRGGNAFCFSGLSKDRKFPRRLVAKILVQRPTWAFWTKIPKHDWSRSRSRSSRSCCGLSSIGVSENAMNYFVSQYEEHFPVQGLQSRSLRRRICPLQGSGTNQIEWRRQVGSGRRPTKGRAGRAWDRSALRSSW